MWKNIILFILVNLLFGGGKLVAQEMGEIEADVEETISDSEAAKAQAQETKDRAVKEKEETAVARHQAEKARQVAAGKKQEAGKELKRLDKEIQGYKNEQAQLKAQLEKHNHDISHSETSIQDGQARAEKTKSALQALQGLRSEKIVKIAELTKKQGEVTAETMALNQQVTEAKADFDKSHADEKAATKKLAKLKSAQAQRKAVVDAQVAKLKASNKVTQDKVAAIENEIRQSRQKVGKLDDEVKAAEGEVQTSDARLQEAKERLTEVRTRSDAKEAELNKRKGSATQKLSSHARETEEAALKIDQARVDQTLARTTAASDKTAVNVQMRKEAPSKMVFTRDCRVYERPDGKSKVLGTKRSGSAVSHGKAENDWVGFPIAGGRKAWVAKGCF